MMHFMLRGVFAVCCVVGMTKANSCPATFTFDESSRYCHKVVLLDASMEDAAAACTSMGSHLVSIETQEEDTYLEQLAKSGLFWTSGNDKVTEGTFLWADGSPLSYTNWYGINPNDQDAGEDCLAVGFFGGSTQWGWHDNPCSWKRTYICEVDMPECPTGFTFKSTVPQYCHKVGNTNVSETDAGTECATLGAQLVSIETAEEDTYLEILTASGLFWTSGNDKVTEGTFLWGDGSPLSYTNWYGINPNDQDAGEDCLVVGYYGGISEWGWHDNPCSWKRASICEIKM